MTDLENRVGSALHAAAAEAPVATGLAAAARRRLTRRRRTTAGAVAAVAVVLLVVPAAALLRSPDREPAPTASTDGWRVESFGTLTLKVPPDWGYDGGRDWCVGDGRPAVTRGEGDFIATDCAPRLSYGVMFSDRPDYANPRPRGLPPGAAVDLVASGSTSAWIVAENEEQLALIKGTVERIDGADPNGCPSVADPDARGAGDRVSVCRYEAGLLEQSELLSEADSESLRWAVDRAQSLATIDVDIPCPPTALAHPEITLRSEVVDADLLPSGCAVASVFLDHGEERLITEDVLFWALSPGWSGFPSEDLPIPDPLRD